MKTVRLGDVCEKIGSGATPRGGSEVYLPSGIALIRSQNIYNDRFERNGLAFIGKKHAEELSNVEVKSGDVLLNITGDSVARVFQVPDDILPARVNQHVAIIRPRTDGLDARYLRYFLASPSMQAHMLALASAGATRNALTKGMIESFKIPAPPLPEQRAIAHVLGTLDDKIELNRKMNATLEAMARALFKSWFVDFDPVRQKAEGRKQLAGMDAETAALFPDSFEDSALGKIPNDWGVSTLGRVVRNYDSKRIPLSGRERERRRGIYPYYGAASVMDYVDDYLFDGVYVLLAEDGSVIDDEDHPVVQYAWGKFWVNNHAHVLQGVHGVSTEFVLLFLKQFNIRPFVTGAVQPKLNQANMNRIPMVVPPSKVSEAFDRTILPLFKKMRANDDQVETLATLRDTLLPKLMSGEVGVRRVEEFSAEAL